MDSQRFTEQIVQYISEKDHPPKRTRELARAMGIAEADYGDFRAAVKSLRKAGRLLAGSRDAVTLPSPGNTLVGRFRSNPRGFGFVVPESPTDHGDLYVPEDRTAGAMTGDLVQARIFKKGKRGGRMIFEGRITRIVERGHSQFVGELQLGFGRWFVRPNGNILHAPILLTDVGAKGAKAGDQVVVEISQYPSETADAEGVIVKVLGKSGDPGVDTMSIIHEFNLPYEFEEAVLEEARRVIAQAEATDAYPDREDLRDEAIITIDPDDARDFDDAISLKRVGARGWELGVHIADVAHFVTEGGAIDATARDRSTSTYFPKFVIPMLPEVLSNGVCSLQENKDRLTRSAFITYDQDGEVTSERFANSVIRSVKRLTYHQATAIIEGQTDGFDEAVVTLAKDMETLARIIERRRIRAGMLTLDLPEAELVHDEANRVIGVERADTSYSHKIIEMFMVEANEAVARMLNDLNVPCLRRIHPEPDAAAGEQLHKFLRAVGLTVPKRPSRSDLQGALSSVAGKPQSFAVNWAVLRSMQRAEYSPRLIGHYALASEHYAHFTSPIRRYPDLTVHRMLDQYLRGKLNTNENDDPPATFEQMEELGAQCSERERRSEDAERTLRTILILRLLESRVGQTVDGLVTGVTNFGVYVQLSDYLIEGLIRFADLADDWWEVDITRGCVVGERTGQRIAIGQPLQVAIAGVDIPSRQLDLVRPGVQSSVSASRKSPQSKRPPQRRAKTVKRRAGSTRPRKRR